MTWSGNLRGGDDRAVAGTPGADGRPEALTAACFRRAFPIFLLSSLFTLVSPPILPAEATSPEAAAPAAVDPDRAAAVKKAIVACSSRLGERIHCAADTAKGVALVRSSGEAPCLLGKTWGYDDQGIWVSDGCSAEFYVGQELPEAEEKEKKEKSPEYIRNRGFRLYEGEKGQIYMRLFTYVRYLNQKGLDPDYTDFFGNPHTVKQREDVQLNKFFLPFSGWFLTPKFRYYLYVWSSNPSQGDPAQVVGAGNISYTFNRFVTAGGGIGCLPTTRSTEGQFPYWLSVDARMTADEFFRGSYTSGFWLKGELTAKLQYFAMVANNLSTLGVSASQLDNTLDTTSLSLQWLPSTGEFGYLGTFGDFDWHEQVATRFGIHYTKSTEDSQSQPGTDSIENSQVRLTDGSSIFTPDLFGTGITVEKVRYEMASADFGIKYKGMALEAEHFWRWLSDYRGTNVGGIEDIDDHGFQVQLSGMILPRKLQGYLGRSEILGQFGDGSESRVGLNYFPVGERELWVNAEWIHLNNCPVGYTAVPYPVGGNGDVYHVNFAMSF